MKKKFCLGILFILLVSTLTVFPVQAAGSTFCIDDGAIVIGEAEDEVNIYVEQNGVKTILDPSAAVTVTGRSITTNTILIQNNVTLNLILHNVNIQSATFLKAPLCIDNGETVQINLMGNNSLIGSDFMAGLQTSGRATVTIHGSGTLTAKGGKDAAGIGGGWRAATPGSDAGTITVGGSVTLITEGGENAAGIGSGPEGNLKRFTVKDSAKITAMGGTGGAGIGSGNGGKVGEILLSGSGSLWASGGAGAAAVGGGNGALVQHITVDGSHSMRLYGGEGAAALGSGKNGSLTNLDLGGTASLRVLGGKNAAAVGLGEGATGSRISLLDKVSVYAMGQSGAGVGCGKNAVLDTLNLDQNCSLQAFGGEGSAALGLSEGAKCNVLTVGGNVKVFALGGKEAAGIGGGKANTPSQITLTGRSDVTAVGGLGGAGVGSGYGAAYANITVSSSAKVYAQGGNYGAGIGSGGLNTPEASVSALRILITDQSNVSAYGGKYAAGIGGGVFGAGSVLEINQNAKVIAVNENEIALTLPLPPTGMTAVSATLSSVNAATSLDLSPYTVDGGSPENGPLIYFHPDPAQVASSGKTFQVGTVLSKEAGNGAGCSLVGTTHISGGASLNGVFGDVTLTLSMGPGATDMVVTLKKNESYPLPQSVTKPGYTFKGWYKDAQLTKPISGSVKVVQDTTVYAGWNAVQVELSEGEIPFAFRDIPYSYQFTTAAGSEETAFSLESGTLPLGLELKESGELCGTPTVAGKYSFTIRYLNSNGTSGTKNVTLGVYGNNTYTFRITTGDTNGSASKAQVTMSFAFTDRFTGERATTQTVNLTSLLLDHYDDPLQRGAIVELPLVFEPNVGVPEEILFTCEDEDGWHCQSVQVRFEGNEMTEAFERIFSLDRWYGTRDDNNFWGVFFTVVVVIASVVIVLGIGFLLLVRFHPPFRKFMKQKGFLRETKRAKPKRK